MLIYIQTSTVQINLSRSLVHIGCILPVSKYICTIHIIELTVAWQNSKPASCKMHALFQNAISFALLRIQRCCMNQYPSFIYRISAVYHSDGRLTYLFLQDTGMQNPDNTLGTHTKLELIMCARFLMDMEVVI